VDPKHTHMLGYGMGNVNARAGLGHNSGRAASGRQETLRRGTEFPVVLCAPAVEIGRKPA